MLFDQLTFDSEVCASSQPLTSIACASATSEHVVNEDGDSSTSENAPSIEAFDIHAHRKALEAALYEAMESPMGRLARLALVKSASAEYHQLDDESNDLSLDHDLEEVDDTLKRATDDNGFDVLTTSSTTPPIYRSPDQSPLTSSSPRRRSPAS